MSKNPLSSQRAEVFVRTAAQPDEEYHVVFRGGMGGVQPKRSVRLQNTGFLNML